MRSRRGLVRVVVGAAALSLVVTGCSDADDPEQPDADPAAAGDYSVAAALEEIPASVAGETPMIQTADLRAATDLAGVERPDSGSREDAAPWLLALTGAGPEGEQPRVFVPMASAFNVQAAAPDEFADVVGWSVLDVDTFVEQATPPETFAVVSGAFDDETLSSGLADVGDGVVTDKEAEDFEQDLGDVSPLSRIGVPVRLGQQAGRIALSPSTPAVQAWLDGDETLRDDPAFAGVAEALDTRSVVSAVLTLPATGGDPAVAPEVPFDAVGIGWSVEDDRPLVHVAYHVADESAAGSAEEGLEALYREGTSAVTGQPFAERMSVEAVETVGSTVVVTVTPTGEGRVTDAFEALTSRDLLFVSR